MEPVIVNYRSIIKYVYHISDIHIHLYKRHEEYKEIFNKLYNYLLSEKEKLKISNEKNKNISTIIIITGDILHCKSDLSPECVNLTYKFFKNLSSIMPVIIIPGNHDVNMNNKSRMDSLTPIIADLPDKYPLYYLSSTGVWIFNNLVISHSSIFDYKIITKEKIDEILLRYEHKFTKTAEKSLRFINLFHGRINGVELYNGIKIRGEIDTTTNKTITMTAFKGYDLCLLGDVHRHHFLSPTEAYAGSLIQQNFGESIDNHGLIKWSLINKKGEFVKIINKYGYYTFNINKCYIEDLSILNLDVNKINNLPENLRLRIYHYRTNKSDLNEFIENIKKNHNVLELTYQEDNNAYIDNDKEKSKMKNELNIKNIDYQNNILKNILIDNIHLDNDIDDEKEIINNILEINKEFNKLYVTNTDNKDEGQKFKLLNLSFNNLFSYGEDNYIDFSNMSGIVGIIASNHSGKSAILDIILYMLYDKFSRKGTIKDIINNNTKYYSAKMELQLNNWIYKIYKYGEKTGKNISNTECRFSKSHIISGREERLEKDTTQKTKAYICSIFGYYEDSINTTFSIQTNSTGFIDSDNTKRRAELERILRMDFLNTIYKKASSNYRDNKAIFEHLQKTMNPERVKDIQTKIEDYEKELKKKCESNNIIKKECKNIQYDIDKLNKKYDSTVENRLNEFSKDLNSNNIDSDIIKQRYIELNEKIELINKKNKEIEKKIKKYLNKLNLTCDISDNMLESNIYLIRNELKNNKVELLKIINNNQNKINNNYLKITNTKLMNYNDLSINDIKEKLKDMNINEYIDEINNYNKKIVKYEKKKKDKEIELHKLSLPPLIEDKINEYHEMKKKFSDYINKFNFPYDINENKFKELIDKCKEYGFIEGIYNHSPSGNISKNIKEKIDEYEKNISLNKEKINNYENKKKIFNDLEKILNNKINNEKLNNENEKKEDIIDINKKEIEGIEKKFEYINKIEKYDIELKNNKLEIKSLNIKLENIKSVEKEIDTLLEKMENNKNIQNKIKIFTEKLTIKKNNNSEITKEIDNIRDNINKLTGKLDRMREDLIEKQEKERLMTIYKYYSDAMKLMPYKLLQNTQNILEKKINDLLNTITDFTLKINITDNKIDIYLTRSIYNGKYIIINNCSGFERFISSLAIRMALLDITQLSYMNIIAIDEGWSCFDKENIANLDIILNYLCQKFDIVLTISHLQSIKQHCDIQLNLKYNIDSGFSHINYS